MILTRRGFLAQLAGSMLAVRHIMAQVAYPGVSYRPYHRCLPDFLSRLAAEAYRVRNDRLSGLEGPQSITEYQRWVRETFWELVGGRPEKTPLNSRVVGSFERPGYRVERLVYESRPNFLIPGNLYLPAEGEPPYPGVLFQMGHSLNGKAASSYQKCCQGLAQLGFVVLGFDPMGQGERTYYPREGGHLTRLSSADEEHTKPGRQMLLLGDTSTRLQVWDAVRSLDYLASHPLVDPSRLASTGQSGGGTLTMLLAAVDDRLAAAAVSCGNTENFACADFVPPGSTDDAEQNLLYSGPEGFDRWDLLYPLAPRPLLILVSSRDWFGTYSPRYLTSGWEEYRKLERLYGILGQQERIKWLDTPLPHNLAYDLRLQIYNWFLRWLKDAEPIAEEPPTRVEEDATLWVCPDGNVVRSWRSESPFLLNRRRALDIRPPEQRADLQTLLGIAAAVPSPRFRTLGRRPSEGVQIEALEVESEESVWLPAWLFLPPRAHDESVVVVTLEPSGRSARWREGDLYQTLAAEGITVCAPDIRWIGDLRPEYSDGARNHASWHQDEEAWAWASLILGRPLLGQRVTDLLAVTKALRHHPSTREKRVVVAARGQLTVPALCLAVLDTGIEALLLSSGLVSFRSLVEEEEYQYPFANFVPRMLLHTDLPQLAASVSPRRIVLAGTLDAAGNPMPVSEVQGIYGSPEGLEIVPPKDWDVEMFKGLVRSD